MRRYLIVITCLGCILVTATLRAQEVNEDDLFSDGESVVPIEEKQDEGVSALLDLESVTFSGESEADFSYDIIRACLEGDQDWGDNLYSTKMKSDLLLDVRLQKGLKSFADIGMMYTPQENQNDPDAEHLQTTLKEFFVDVNIAHKMYFRFGKQNLKWGQGYFWNPTDLISVDRKDFGNLDARREGVYGLKMHVPFGASLDLYGFIKASGANKTDELAVAGKVETVLPGNIQAALSAWTKKHYNAVYGLDFRTRKFLIDWWGELSLSHGANRSRLEVMDGEYLDTMVTDEWLPLFSFGFSKAFDFRDINDRIWVAGEFYYNDSGYEDNMLSDETTRNQFLEEGYFESGNYGKYYTALFSKLSRFLVTEMTLELNAIGNLSDSSWIVSSGVEYELAKNASLSFKLDGYVGSKNREFTLEGKAISAEIAVELVF